MLQCMCSPAGCCLEWLGEGQTARDVQAPHTAHPHAEHALIQAGDNLAGAYPDVKRLLLKAVLKDAALLIHGNVVGHYLVPNNRCWPSANHNVLVLQACMWGSHSTAVSDSCC